MIALLVAIPASAQFANHFPPTGNTGVGTASPTELFEVSTVASNGHLQMKLNSATDRFAQMTYYENNVLKWNLYNDFANDNLTYGNGTGPKIVITPTGNLGIGTTAPIAKLHVAGDIHVTGNIAAKYQDFAEWVPATEKMEPGTVVVLNPAKSNEVMPASQAYDTTVAGVVSSQPGLILGEAGDSKVQVATVGRVRVKASAVGNPIQIGDLLVSSAKTGMAMKSQPMDFGGRKFHQPGTIIGKALEPLAGGEGEILVLLSLQ
jgi:hypothetical protein